MKKISTIPWSLLLLSTFFLSYACSKDNVQEETLSRSEKPKKILGAVTDIPYSQISLAETGTQDMVPGHKTSLHFANNQAFIQTYQSLREQVDKADEYISNGQDNIDEYLPLKQFNQKYAFRSLQSCLSDQQILPTEKGIGNKDPDDDYILDEALRSLFNEDREVKIGDTIYEYTEQGYNKYFKTPPSISEPVHPGFFSTIPTNNANANSSRPVYKQEYSKIYVATNTGSFCKSNVKRSYTKEVGNYRMVCKISHWSIFFISGCTAKVTNFQRTASGWEKYKCSSSVCVLGNVLEDFSRCDGGLYNINRHNITKEKNRKMVEQTISWCFPGRYKTQSTWVYAKIKGCVEGITTLYLTFN